MLDPKRIRHEEEVIRQGLLNRCFGVDLLETFIMKDKAWRKALQELEQLKHQQHEKTPKGKPSEETLVQLKVLSEQIKEKQTVVNGLELELEEVALYLPNVPDSSVPIGKSETDNQVVYEWGEIPHFSFSPKSHDEIGEYLKIFNFEKASQLSGSRFSLSMGLGAKLERCLAQFMLDSHNQKGYVEVSPPVLVNSQSLRGTGQLPKFSDDLFKLESSDFWLSPTSEVQLTNLYANSILDFDVLPIKLTSFTQNFRKEAGSYGKDMKGLIRLHQFPKVELVQFVHPDHSFKALEDLCADAEFILKALNLPYRKVLLCSGDMGFSSTKTYDLEVWMPSQGKYREISSCSNFLDFQARRAMIRFKFQGKIYFAHTLNGSGLAVGRTVAAILENYQQPNGEVLLPDVLKPYMGVDSIG